MRTDPGMQSIREIRERISHEFGNDPRRLVEYCMEYQFVLGMDCVGHQIAVKAQKQADVSRLGRPQERAAGQDRPALGELRSLR